MNDFSRVAAELQVVEDIYRSLVFNSQIKQDLCSKAYVVARNNYLNDPWNSQAYQKVQEHAMQVMRKNALPTDIFMTESNGKVRKLNI